MRRLAALARAALASLGSPAPAATSAPAVEVPTWLRFALGAVGSVALWKVIAWLYVDLVRPRLDRFVRDSRLRSGAEDDAITLGILERNGDALDAHIVGALRREPDAVAHVIAESLRAHVIEHGAFLRREVFADEIRDTAAFRSRMSQSQTTLEAVSAALEGLSAAQLAQGRALADMPKLTDMLARLAPAMEGVTAELKQLSVGQGEMRGKLDLVERIVLGAHPPPGIPERREQAPRRAEDLVAGRLIDEIRHAGDGTGPHTEDPKR